MSQRLSVLGLAAAALLMAQTAQAITVTMKNNCSNSITVYVGGASYASLGAGASTSDNLAAGWDGRIQDNLTVGASLSEWNLDASGTDWYDVSYVDGYNDMLGITVSTSSCTSPGCTSKPSCPTVTNGPICDSPCTAYNTAQYCCSGADDTSAACDEAAWPAPGSTYVNDIHADCSGEYAYAYDDNVGLHTCPTGPSYTVTFCDNGGASGGSGGSGGSGSISNGVHYMEPACATGSRLDNSGGGTTNGNPEQIWADSPGNANQEWNFALVSGSATYNMAVDNGPYCLAASGTASGDRATVWSCNGAATQDWVAAAVSGGYNFAVQGYALCLDVSGAGSANGTAVQIYTCNGTNAQAWAMEGS